MNRKVIILSILFVILVQCEARNDLKSRVFSTMDPQAAIEGEVYKLIESVNSVFDGWFNVKVSKDGFVSINANPFAERLAKAWADTKLKAAKNWEALKSVNGDDFSIVFHPIYGALSLGGVGVSASIDVVFGGVNQVGYTICGTPAVLKTAKSAIKGLANNFQAKAGAEVGACLDVVFLRGITLPDGLVEQSTANLKGVYPGFSIPLVSFEASAASAKFKVTAQLTLTNPTYLSIQVCGAATAEIDAGSFLSKFATFKKFLTVVNGNIQAVKKRVVDIISKENALLNAITKIKKAGGAFDLIETPTLCFADYFVPEEAPKTQLIDN